MKQGTFAWAMDQLLAGKKVTRSNYANKDYYLQINKEGNVVRDVGLPFGLDYADTSAIDWIIWTLPVNYPVGTFPWAWEQLKAGKKIKRKGCDRYFYDLTSVACAEASKTTAWTNCFIAIADINATDWEVVE